MSRKRIAFIKFGGLSAGGTERWLQEMAVQLSKLGFPIDFYYCDAAPYLGSTFKHAGTDESRRKYLADHKVNLIEFRVKFKDLSSRTHNWVETDFWEVFDESKYAFAQSAIAGHAEYPFFKLGIPVIDFVALSGNVNNSSNLKWTIHLSNWQRNIWRSLGGDFKASTVIPIPAFPPVTCDNLRSQLGIDASKIVVGFHQRNDPNIFSEVPLNAFSALKSENTHFILLGGSDRHRTQAIDLEIKNVSFLDHDSSPELISKFLNTLDIFSHGRSDGETFGSVIAEAMMHSLPILSHSVKSGANAQKETMGPAGFFVKNQGEYTKHLKLLINDAELRKQLGESGKDFALKNYGVECAGIKLASLYNFLFPGSFPDVQPALTVRENSPWWEDFMYFLRSLVNQIRSKIG